MNYFDIKGVPDFTSEEFHPKKTKYCICIPIINEMGRINVELERAQKAGVDTLADIILCDGGSTDGSTDYELLKTLGVNTLLVKTGEGKQGAQLRMGFWWALQRGYEGIITIDGNNKDSIEDVGRFVDALENGYDFVQGSRFVPGGKAINTPILRLLPIKLIHAPVTSFIAKYHFTDTTNAFRAHSRKYLEHPDVQPFRDVFISYELLGYLSIRASWLHLRVCEIPVTRAYPKSGKTPTKISFFRGNWNIFRILINNLFGKYNP